MKTPGKVLLLLALVFFFTPVFAALPPASEQSLGKIPAGLDNPKANKVVFSANGLHFVLVQRHGGKFSALWDNNPGADYDELGDIVFSPDGQRMAYAARNATSCTLVVDGKVAASNNGIIGDPFFSPDSQHFVCIAQIGNQFTVIYDGKEWPLSLFNGYTSDVMAFAFSPDSQHLAISVGNGTKHRVLLDGKPGPEFDGIELRGRNREEPWFVFSADSQHYAYRGIVSDKRVVVADGKEGPASDQSPTQLGRGTLMFYENGITFQPRPLQNSGSLIISPDGQHVAYLAYQSTPGSVQAFVVLDGKAGPAYDSIDETSLQFSPDGKHLVYLAAKGAKKVVVWDGHESAEYDHVMLENSQLLFSADSQHLAYLASRGAQWFAVRDNIEGTLFGGTGTNLALSPDGQHLAYIAVQRGGGNFIVIDGKAQPIFDSIGNDPLSLTSNGTIFVYLAIKDGHYVAVVNGKPSPQYDLIENTAVSTDGRHYGFWAKKGAKWVLVLDGVENRSYDDPNTIFGHDAIPPPVFHLAKNSPALVDFLAMAPAQPEVTAEYLAVRNGILYRVTQPLHAQP